MKDKYFFRLFYRERINELLQSLRLQLSTRDTTITIQTIKDRLEQIFEEAENDDLCHDACKGMYFCNKPKGHKGKHSEDDLLFR